MKHALLIGQTPLQLVNLIEAEKTYSLNGVYVLFFDCQTNHRRMQELVTLFDLQQVYFFALSRSFRLLFPLKLHRLLRLLPSPIDYVVYGTYASWAAWLVNSLPQAHPILVDDGQKTLTILQRPQAVGLHKNKFLKRLNKSFVQRSEFFTYYADYALEKAQLAQKNTLQFLHRLRPELPQLDLLAQRKVVFIGTNILQTYPSLEAKMAEVVARHRHEGPLLYIMHRYDDEILVKGWAQRYGFACVKLDYPLELYFPYFASDAIVCSFGSSALDTLALLRPDLPITLYRLPLSGFASQAQAEGFAHIWDYCCRQPMFTCIELNSSP
ncbi:MAG: hypothetical protein JXR44_00670 [Thiotrichales bacterium]|nr:hypothetical protein [Thiotrichales bacterium]